MRVAIVHDQLTKPGGAEKVLEALLEIYPNADIYTVIYQPKFYKDSIISNHRIYTSYLNALMKIPKSEMFYRLLFYEFPKAVESFNLYNYDLVISNHAVVSHGVITYQHQTHVAYTHSPIRAMWSEYHKFIKKFPFWYKDKYPFGLAKWALNKFHLVRQWDYLAGQRPDAIFSNSKEIKNRVEKYYKRPVESVIYPPVDVSEYSNYVKKHKPRKKNFYFALSRLQEYKRFDIIVEAFKKMPNKKVIIAGDGPEYKRLKKLAHGHDNIELPGFLSIEDKFRLYAEAKAFIFPAYEDFGIVPLEAQASNTPVIAYAKGGATETVIANKTGIFFKEQTPESLIQAVKEFENMKFSTQELQRNAKQFSKKRFLKEFEEKVNKIIEQKKK